MRAPKDPPDPDAVDPASSPEAKSGDGEQDESSTRSALRLERQRMAGLLHDTVCQELTGISLMAHAAAHEYRALCPEAEQKLKEFAGMIQQVGINLHGLVQTLRVDPPEANTASPTPQPAEE